MTGTLHKDVFTFMTISHWVLLRMRNVWNQFCRENRNIDFIFSDFFSENRDIYEIVSKNMVEPERPQTVPRMAPARGILRKPTRAQAHTRTRAPTHPHTHTHARTHTHTHTHTHTEMCNTCCCSMATLASWTRLSVTLCVHCLSCLFLFTVWT
jgi:hypothetical protein